MQPSALLKPEKVKTNRSQLRRRQSTILKRAKGRTVVVVTGRGDRDEKCVLDREYFEELLGKLGAAIETIEISSEPKLFARPLRSAKTMEDDVRQNRLYSLEDAFGDH